MRSTLEPVEPTKVRINVVVEPDELRPAIDRTARRLSREVRVPGFRKGKVPRQVIEARIGRDALLAEAIEQEAVPEFYAKAIEELGVQPLSRARVDPPDYTDGQPLEFSATFPPRPPSTASRSQPGTSPHATRCPVAEGQCRSGAPSTSMGWGA